jgi:hypothetical protein
VLYSTDYETLDDQEWLPSPENVVRYPGHPYNGVKVSNDCASPLKLTYPASVNLLNLSALPSSSSLLLHLVDHLDNGTPPALDIRNMGTFFSYIPSRLGHSRALDDAVQCICTAYSALLRPNGSVKGQDRHEYYRALRSLRLACVDREEVLTSNVLCAAILLSWYEVGLDLNFALAS